MLKSSKNVDGYSGYQDIYNKIEETSDSNKHEFPISSCHLIETEKRAKKDSRNELLKFMFKISKLNSMYSFNVWDLEVENAILTLLGKKTYNLKKIIFGKGISHCYGLESQYPLLETDIELMLVVFNKMCNSEDHKRFLKENLKRDIKLADSIEKHRKQIYHPDKKVKKDIEEAEFYLESIVPKVIKVLQNLGFNNEETGSFILENIFSSKDAAQNFLKKIPSAYVFYMMNYTRNANKSRAIKPNDIYDLHCLSAAIPYCDIVITERSWANILNQNKIGDMYDTIIINKIEELDDLL